MTQPPPSPPPTSSAPGPARTSRPDHWWGTRPARFVMLLAALAVLLLVPIHLTPRGALIVGVVGFAGVALLAFTGVRRLVNRVRVRAASELHVLGRTVDRSGVGRDVTTLGGVIRAAGVAVPALLFFSAWALLFAVIWAADPTACAVATARCDGAFVGLGNRPIFGDFVYYAVNIAFANPPPDLVAQSRVARAAGTVEIVAGAGFLAAFLGAFLARGREGSRSAPPGSDPAA